MKRELKFCTVAGGYPILVTDSEEVLAGNRLVDVGSITYNIATIGTLSYTRMSVDGLNWSYGTTLTPTVGSNITVYAEISNTIWA